MGCASTPSHQKAGYNERIFSSSSVLNTSVGSNLASLCNAVRNGVVIMSITIDYIETAPEPIEVTVLWSIYNEPPLGSQLY